MEAFSISTSRRSIATTPLPYSSTVLAAKQYSSTASTTTPASSSVSFSLKPPAGSSNSANSSALSGNLRRPNKSLKAPTSSSKQNPKTPYNPLKNPLSSSHVPTTPNHSHSLTNKLWLSSKLAPPPPPPPPPTPVEEDKDNEYVERNENANCEDPVVDNLPTIQFRQEGKIFVGNLPNWAKKNDVAEFFRQFGPIKNVILIKGHHETDRNAGFGFVIFGGSAADKSAMKAVEFDGIEFHGRILTVKLDDGRRLKEKSEERARWLEGDSGVEFPSQWHEEREASRKEFRNVVETEPENWQAVVQSFERIKKVVLL